MNENLVKKIKNNSDYKTLLAKRGRLSIVLSLSMLFVYFSFIIVIAFFPEILSSPLFTDGITTVGIPVGIFIIIFAFVLTGIYTFKANGEFDTLTNNIKQSIKED